MSAIIKIPVNPTQSKGSFRICKEKSTNQFLLLGPMLLNDKEWNWFIFVVQTWQTLGKVISPIYPARKVSDVEQLIQARVRRRICVFCMLDHLVIQKPLSSQPRHSWLCSESWVWSLSTTTCICVSVLLLQFARLGHHQQQWQMWLAITT